MGSLSLALVVEAIHLGDLAGLVVATDEGDTVRVANLEDKEEEEGLDGVEATVDKVTCIQARQWQRSSSTSIADSPMKM